MEQPQQRGNDGRKRKRGKSHNNHHHKSQAPTPNVAAVQQVKKKEEVSPMKDQPEKSKRIKMEGVEDEKPKTAPNFMTDTKFATMPINEKTVKALTQVMGYEVATLVQRDSIPIALKGGDLLAKAKTGTGKTIAFLTPAIENLLANPPASGDISVLMISPTRELALQIKSEADSLLTYHPFKCQCVMGQTNVKTERSNLNQKRADFLVGTPGRLLDHLNNTPGFLPKLKNLRILVLDEADLLLEMGFRPDITTIIGCLTKSRQTLLFSATVPKEIEEMAGLALKREYSFVNTVIEGESNTHSHVDQEYVLAPLDKQLSVLYKLIEKQMAIPGYKILVFFTTARLTQFMSMAFNYMGIKVMDMHSRLSQGQRNRTSEEFRSSTNVIMFSSDVSARGMDYPDVTNVIQVGMPSNKAQYIHRLGRTARAGKGGSGTLVLADFEKFFLAELEEVEVVPSALFDGNWSTFEVPENVTKLLAAVPKDEELVLRAEQAYQAWLGFYNSNLKLLGWDKPELVKFANAWAFCMGLVEIPVLSMKMVGKMGLRGIPELRVQGGNNKPRRNKFDQKWGRGGGGRRGGGGGRGGRGH